MLISDTKGDLHFPKAGPTSSLLTCDGQRILRIVDPETGAEVPADTFGSPYFLTKRDMPVFGVKLREHAKPYVAVLPRHGCLPKSLAALRRQTGDDLFFCAADSDRPGHLNRVACRPFLPICVRTGALYSPAVQRSLRHSLRLQTAWWTVWGTVEDYASAGYELFRGEPIGVHTLDEFGTPQFLVPCMASPLCDAILANMYCRPVVALWSDAQKARLQRHWAGDDVISSKDSQDRQLTDNTIASPLKASAAAAGGDRASLSPREAAAAPSKVLRRVSVKLYGGPNEVPESKAVESFFTDEL